MEQILSVFGIEWKLLLAQVVNFGLLVAGLTYFLYKPVMSTLSKRRELIAKGVEDAEKAGKELATIEASKSGIIEAANVEASSIVRRAEEEGKRERTELVKTAHERAESILSDAKVQAEELRKEALQKSEKEIARTAILAAEKILKES